MAQIQYNFNKNDEYFTPSYAVYPIIKHLRPNSTIWCPFDKEDSEYVKVFKKEGFEVIFGHIETGQDFFEADVLKGDIFKRLYEIGIPFAMLINFQGIFDHKKRFEMFKSNKVEMLWLSPRVNYIKMNETKASGVPFQSGYLCSQIFEDSLNFEYLDKSL